MKTGEASLWAEIPRRQMPTVPIINYFLKRVLNVLPPSFKKSKSSQQATACGFPMKQTF